MTILKKEISDLQQTISMKCLECCNCEIQEVKVCLITGCPLWKKKPVEAKGLHTLVKQLRQNNLVIPEAKI